MPIFRIRRQRLQRSAGARLLWRRPFYFKLIVNFGATSRLYTHGKSVAVDIYRHYDNPAVGSGWIGGDHIRYAADLFTG